MVVMMMVSWDNQLYVPSVFVHWLQGSVHLQQLKKEDMDSCLPFPDSQLSFHRCDLIFLLFDPAKLDISDEFKAVRMA